MGPRGFGWLLLVCLSVAACGSDDGEGGSGGGAATGGSAGNAGASGSGGTSGGAGTSGSGGVGGSAGAALTPAPPVIEMVMPMPPAGLHVTWQNVQADCDEVEGERKGGADPYAVVFTVPGYVDNSHDGSATDTTTEYTYRLRCRKGTGYSSYSNEMSGTPQ